MGMNVGDLPFIIVAGFGSAGATAAVAAASNGARVLVVDSAPAKDRGGNTAYNSFYMPLNSSDEMMNDFVRALEPTRAPWTSYFGETADCAEFWGGDRGAFEAWANEAIPTVKWLESLGVTFSLRNSDAGFKPGLTPDGGGPALLDLLELKARELGVEFEYGTALVGLEANGEGAVAAAVLESSTARRTLACDSVILATGGYQGNQELMVRWVGPRQTFAAPLCKGGYYCRGEGMLAAMGLGAALTGDTGMWTPTAMDARGDGDYWSLAGFQMAIMVNRQGKRFTDESQWDPALNALIEQDGGIAFTIVDSRACRNKDYDILFVSGRHREGLNYSMLHKNPLPPITAATIEELAQKIGVPVNTLAETIAEFNAGCNDSDDPGECIISKDGLMIGGSATRNVTPPKAALAYSVKDGPFHAWPIKAGNVFGLAGLKIDRHGRVLTEKGRDISGLYAAGDAAAGFFNYYTWYSTTLKAIVFGRLSAVHAATTYRKCGSN